MAKSDLTGSENSQIIWAVSSTAIVLLIIISFFVIKAAKDGSSSATDTGSSAAPAELVTKVTTVPNSVFTTVATGANEALPKLITGAPALTANNKPSITYIGAEYCPYCATERWPMVIALSRFGTFSNLGVTHSSSTDVYPNTQTFSFHGSSYTSDYINFTAVETKSNIPSAGDFTTLDPLTTDEQNLLNTYDAAPYVPASGAGGIPFIDFGGKFLVNGSTYDPSLLQGKTADDIASVLTDASNSTTQGIIGAANALTATICSLTNDTPSKVCSDPGIQTLKLQINSQASSN